VKGRLVILVTGKAAPARGFTLLEILVVLMILALLAAAWPVAGSRLFPAQALRDETARLSGAARFARSTALVRNSRTAITLLPDGRGYRCGGVEHRLPNGVLLALNQSSSSTEVTFYPDGSSTGGHLVLRSGARTAAVVVGPLTGHVEITL